MAGIQNLNGRAYRLEEKLGQRKKGIRTVFIFHDPLHGTNQIPQIVVIGPHFRREEEQLKAKALEKWKEEQFDRSRHAYQINSKLLGN